MRVMERRLADDFRAGEATQVRATVDDCQIIIALPHRDRRLFTDRACHGRSCTATFAYLRSGPHNGAQEHARKNPAGRAALARRRVRRRGDRRDRLCGRGKRRLRAVHPGPPDRDAEPAGLVGEVAWMPVPGKTRAPVGKAASICVVALERRGLGVLRPVRLEGDLRHLAVIGPAGGDALGALRRSAVQEHHVGVLGVDLIEPSQIRW